MENSNLLELQPAHWRELQAKFKVNWPEHIVAYSTLDNAIKKHAGSFVQANPIKIYTFNSWKENGTFIATLVSNNIVGCTGRIQKYHSININISV